MAIEVQTPRRSTRFQPLVFIEKTTEVDGSLRWEGDPILSRKTRATDLDRDDDIEIEHAETTFFRALTKISSNSSSKKGKKKSTDETFKLGDCVLVKTQAKHPSVGIITAMWEVLGRTEDDEEDEKMLKKVRVHWFLRPNELASIRARREHREVCFN